MVSLNFNFIRNRISSWKTYWTLSELSGSLGDLGTFIPLIVLMSKSGSIDFAPALFFAGIANVITSFSWDIPMPVQPMKSIAAVAIKEKMSKPEVAASGIFMGVFVLILGIPFRGVCGMDIIAKIVPLSIVGGLQVGLGFSMIVNAINYAQAGKKWSGLNGYGMAVAIGILSLTLFSFQKLNWKLPTALILFIIGIILSLITIFTNELGLNYNWTMPVNLVVADLDRESILNGIIQGSLPQIPLTALNSVVAVCALSKELFPDRPATRGSVTRSVGILNLIGCCFGGMPICHGSGGLAGQYAFGARRGLSIFFLGVVKATLALTLSGVFVPLLENIPSPIMGALLVFAGMELCVIGSKSLGASYSGYLTAGACVVLNTWQGCLVGLVAVFIEFLAIQFNTYLQTSNRLIDSVKEEVDDFDNKYSTVSPQVEIQGDNTHSLELLEANSSSVYEEKNRNII